MADSGVFSALLTPPHAHFKDGLLRQLMSVDEGDLQLLALSGTELEEVRLFALFPPLAGRGSDLVLILRCFEVQEGSLAQL